MRQLACLAVFLAIVLNESPVLEALSFKIGNIRIGRAKHFDDNYENVKSDKYNIMTTINKNKGKCTKHIAATGNGVGDTFELPCSPNGLATITSGKVMIFGNPEVDGFSIYSNQPSTMFVFKDNKCTKRTYKTVDRKTTPEIGDLNDEDCKKVQKKIKYMLDQHAQYVDALDKHADEIKLDSKDTKESQDSDAKSQSKTASKSAADVIPSDTKQGGTNSYGFTGSSNQPQNSKDGVMVIEVHSGSGKTGSDTAAQPAGGYYSYTPGYADYWNRRSGYFTTS